jgi:hypothetical protein
MCTAGKLFRFAAILKVTADFRYWPSVTVDLTSQD